jgi:hypothetical protein
METGICQIASAQSCIVPRALQFTCLYMQRYGTGSIQRSQSQLLLVILLAEDGISYLITHVSYVLEHECQGLVLGAYILCSHQQGLVPCVEGRRL